MTKTLSEQLCEICELERIQVTHNEQTKKTTYTKLLVDFEQPENFVKLWELKIKHPDAHELLSLNQYFNAEDRQDFLSTIILKFQLGSSDFSSGYTKQWIKTVKQSIRDYDGWIWG